MIFNKLFERRSFENPNTPLSDPANWLANMFGGPTDAGVPVNEQSALMYSAVFAAVRVLSESIAVLPLMVFRRDGDSKIRDNDHPAFDLVHNKPNDEMTPSTFKETIQGHLSTWGNGFAAIGFDGGGQPVSMMPLMPDRTRAVRSNGRLTYKVQTQERGEVTVMPQDMIHIPGLGFDGLTGYSPIGMSRQIIGMGLAAESFNNRFFSNGAWMGGVLEHPGELGTEAAKTLRMSFSDRQAGVANAFKPAILEEGMTWKQIGIPSRDASFLETRKFQVTEIARMYRVPPHMLGDLDRATFSNIEQLSLEFIKYTLAIWINKWEQELTRKLIVGNDAGKFFIEFNLDAFLRGDIASRYNAYKVGREGGWLSINQILNLENMNPIEGGDEHLQPLNFKPVGEDDPLDPDPEPEPDPDVRSSIDAIKLSFRWSFNDAAARVSRRQSDRVRRAVSKPKDSFDRCIDKLFDTHAEFVFEAFAPCVRSLSENVYRELLGAHYVQTCLWEQVSKVLRDFAQKHCGEMMFDAIESNNIGNIDDVISGWLTGYPKWWPCLIDDVVDDIVRNYCNKG